jgi:uncharacterized cupredoxin-like copper-binding protein
MRIIAITVVLLGTMLLSAGCRERSAEITDTGFGTATGQSLPDISPMPSPFASDTALTSAATIEVRLIDHEIQMPASVPAGRRTFRIVNEGEHPHNFEIEGQGIERKLPNDLRTGENGTLEVDLQPGTYRVYCPVNDHATKHNMEMQLTVQ